MTSEQVSSQVSNPVDGAAPAPSAASLERRALRGSVWTVLGFGGSQVLRFGGNLVLTRLLFPEAFGLMALVQVFMQGLEMFSDLGIVPSIIQNPRSDRTFLNTAWTLQAVRGAALAVVAALLAYPLSLLYDEPLLATVLPVAGLTAAIAGFNSTGLATANRSLQLGRLTLLELGSYSVGLAMMVGLAWRYQSVWALVVGGLVTSALKAGLSHRIFPGPGNGFCWDRSALKEIYRFGRWIFLGTLMTFLAGRGDRLLLGWVMDVRFLGIYTLAAALAGLPWQVIQKLVNRVLFPSYAEVFRQSPQRVYALLRRSRLIMIAGSWAASLVFLIWGQSLVQWLYDPRYADAGWMLQVIACGSLVSVLSGTYNGVLLAEGKSRLVTLLLAIQIGVQFTGMAVGFHLGGQAGVVVGIVVGRWVMYPCRSVVFARMGLWQPEVDLPFIALATAIVGLVLYGG